MRGHNDVILRRHAHTYGYFEFCGGFFVCLRESNMPLFSCDLFPITSGKTLNSRESNKESFYFWNSFEIWM